jgi:hypothetical protein
MENSGMKEITQYKYKSSIKHYCVYLCSSLLLASCSTADADHMQKKEATMHKKPEITNTNSEMTATNSTPTSFAAPYPFTAEELWQNMLKIIALPEGYVTKADVEKIFKVQLRLSESFFKTDKQQYYIVRNGIDWHFDLSVLKSASKQSNFFFSWGHAPKQPYIAFQPAPENMCIKAKDALPAIEALGWQEEYDLWDDTHAHPPGKQFKKGEKSKLVVNFQRAKDDNFKPYQNSCLIDLEIWS